MRVRENQLDGRTECHFQGEENEKGHSPARPRLTRIITRAVMSDLRKREGAPPLCCQLFEAAGGAQHADKCSTAGFIWRYSPNILPNEITLNKALKMGNAQISTHRTL